MLTVPKEIFVVVAKQPDHAAWGRATMKRLITSKTSKSNLRVMGCSVLVESGNFEDRVSMAARHFRFLMLWRSLPA
jgi:hypothetical protein